MKIPDEDKAVLVDMRALADMRSRLLSLEREFPSAISKTASLAEELAKAEVTTSRLQEEAKGLREELGASRRSVDELVSQVRMKEADAMSAAHEVEKLRQELRRIKESKAWRAVSRYRRFVNWSNRRVGKGC